MRTQSQEKRSNYANPNPISGKKTQICQCKPNLRKKEGTMRIQTQSQEKRGKYANANPISGKKRQLRESKHNLRKKEANTQMQPNLNPLHCLSPSPYNIPSPIAPCIAPNWFLLYNCIHVSLLIARKIHFPYPQATMQPLLFCIWICPEYSKWIFQVILVYIHICKISFGQNTIQWIFQVIHWSHWFVCSDCSVNDINWYTCILYYHRSIMSQ